jgi:DNA-binding transcriptional regulator YhcF (GntR family)
MRRQTVLMGELPLGLPAPDESLHHWLYRSLRQAIVSGRVRGNSILPGTRTLALQYGVARGTIRSVYCQLLAEGYLIARQGSATRVSPSLPDAAGLMFRQDRSDAMAHPSPSVTRCSHAIATMDPGLIALLDLRASQINGCLLCVRHYLSCAMTANVPLVKAENIETWRCSDAFSPDERAALAWVENLACAVESAADSICSTLKDCFDDAQIAELIEYWEHSELWSARGVLRCCVGAESAMWKRG